MTSEPPPSPRAAPPTHECVLGCVVLLGVAVVVGGGVGSLVGWWLESWVWGLVVGGGALILAGFGLVLAGALLTESPGVGEKDEQGQQQGLWVWKDGNGRLRREARFQDGSLHGTETRWHSNGRKQAEGDYLDGKKHGLWTTWDEEGRLHSRITWAGDKKNGPAIWWHTNGRLWIETSYADDELHGAFREWRRDGHPRCVLTFYRGAPLEPGWHRFQDPAQLGVTFLGRVGFWLSWLFWVLVALLFVTAIVRALGLGVALLALMLIIVVHELGHLLAANVCRIPIKRFQIGLGPAILRFWWGCTRFQVAPLPFWGYVAPYVMKPTELAHFQAARKAVRQGQPPPPEPTVPPQEEQQPTMELASRPRRFLFYIGGVVFNLLAAGILIGLHFALPEPPPTAVEELLQSFHALKQRDEQLKQDRANLHQTKNDLQAEEKAVSNDGGLSEPERKKQLKQIQNNLKQCDLEAARLDLLNQELAVEKLNWENKREQWKATLRDPGEGWERIGRDIMENGWRGTLAPLAFLNVFLALFNLLPIPPLDGYRCLLVLIGMMLRRDVPKKYQWPFNLIGCFILLLLLALSTVDLVRELWGILSRKGP